MAEVLVERQHHADDKVNATISTTMVHKIRYSAQWALPAIAGICLLALFVSVRPASAITQLPTPSPKPGSFGIEATKVKAPPTQGASISTPGNGGSFTTSPITVTGICLNDLLVQVFNNGVLIGSVMCKNGSFTMQVSLFVGTNELSAMVYDDLEQPGPPSNIVTVNYTNAKFSAFGALVTLTSSYGRRSAAADTALSWPLQLSGGTGPYAFSIDWGDGSAAELKSQSLAGLVTISHVFKKAGIYQVNVKVTDVNGVSAFLQLVAVANGKVDGTGTPSAPNTAGTTTKTEVLIIPTAVSLVLLAPAFWLGRRSQIVSIRNKMLRDQAKYEEKRP